MEYPGFGERLRRLIDHRKLNIAELTRATGIAQAEFEQVLDGAPPSQLFVRQLAPALGLHAADLFVVAEMAVPDDLVPLDADAGEQVSSLIWLVRRLPLSLSSQLRHHVRSLPQYDRVKPIPIPKTYEQYPSGSGAVILGMLANRNLTWIGSVRMLALLTDHYMLSTSTVWGVGHGRVELTPELLTAFATVLGISAQDLAALAGIEPPEATPDLDPAIVNMVELIWEARRLTLDQVEDAISTAESMLQSA